MKFLVVDDSNTARKMIFGSLRQFGFSDIVEARDGREALAILAETEVDFIITDWNMVGMDGIEFVENVRGSQWHNLPILMVTANNAFYDVNRAIQAGVDNYIVKPLQPQVLNAKLADICAKRGIAFP